MTGLLKIIALLFVVFCHTLNAQIIYTIAGDTLPDWSGDGGPATDAGMDPYGLAMDAAGNIYIADYLNNCVRKVNTSVNPYTISTVAGQPADSIGGYSGDGGPATAALLFNPAAVALDDSGNIYIADFGNSRIRKVYAQTGIIVTYAGNGIAYFGGDGGPATAASLQQPVSLAIDTSGNVYIADEFNNCVRKVTASTGIITTVAGIGLMGGYSGNGGLAIDANLSIPTAVAVDDSGNIYIADNGNNVIREVRASTGNISTIAGNGIQGFAGDDSLAIKAEFSDVTDVKVDRGNNVFIADEGDGLIREINAFTGIIHTIAGGGAYYKNDTFPTATQMTPFGLLLDPSLNLYEADGEFYMVRKIMGVDYTGINEFKSQKNTLKIFPNPCSGDFYIECSCGQLQLYDLSGRLVFSRNILNETCIQAGNLARGVYDVRLISNSSILNGKLVVISH